jgi:hypothetical protein
VSHVVARLVFITPLFSTSVVVPSVLFLHPLICRVTHLVPPLGTLSLCSLILFVSRSLSLLVAHCDIWHFSGSISFLSLPSLFILVFPFHLLLCSSCNSLTYLLRVPPLGTSSLCSLILFVSQSLSLLVAHCDIWHFSGTSSLCSLILFVSRSLSLLVAHCDIWHFSVPAGSAG